MRGLKFKSILATTVFLAAGSFLSALPTAAGPVTADLTGNLTADNAFYAYVSTNNAVLGTLVVSGNSWPDSFSLASSLTPGVTNYLQIEAINYGGPGGFIGSFSLNNNQFQFANGGQTLSTDTTNWLAIYNNSNSDPNAQQAWVTPTVLPELETYPWGTPSPISPSAQWIWASGASGSDGCQLNGGGGNCTVDLSTAISSTATPLPAGLPLFASGLGVLGLLMRGRKRKSTIAA